MKHNFKYAAVWFLIGLGFIKFLGIDQLSEQREVASWLKTEATVLSSDVSLGSSGREYDLGIRFRATVNDKIHSYTCFKQSGPKGALDNLTETTYAPGAEITVFINPDNPSDYRFPQRAIGPWITGILPGTFFSLIGFSILRGPGKTESGSEPENE